MSVMDCRTDPQWKKIWRSLLLLWPGLPALLKLLEEKPEFRRNFPLCRPLAPEQSRLPSKQVRG